MKKVLILALVLALGLCCLCVVGPAAAEEQSGEGSWADRIAISGAVEAEAGFVSADYNDSTTDDVDESDIVLATVELGLDAEIHKHVSGHVLLLWEEDDTDPIDMDEGYITIEGKDVVPLYLNAGKLYVPFGNYESHMISSPMTLELGETGQSAIQLGVATDWIDASVALFNGDVDETGEDNTIGSYAGAVQFTLPEGTVPNFGLAAGVSYISNLADSDGLGEEIATPDGTIEEHVAGLGAFVHVSFLNMFFLKAEYIGAMDKFKAGELNFDGGEAVEPSAMNVELAVAPLENLEFAVRYAQSEDIKGGIDDTGAFPESQYGFTVAYGLFDGTTLALEYQTGEYENKDAQSVITTQLAVEF
jgi:hypothetical protein